MSKANLLTTVVNVIGKNVGLAVIDTFSAGAGSAIKNSITEIQEHTKITNDALYYMQVATFLETVDLDQEEVTEFLNRHPDNQRLGLEIFKILESTYLKEQAEYKAIAFRKYVYGEIDKKKFNQYIHVIKQLTTHIVSEIETDLFNVKTYNPQGLPNNENDSSVYEFVHTPCAKNQTLQTIGFVLEDVLDIPINYSGSVQPKMIYKRTGLYLDFYLDIIKRE
jgi:hypothetical protein